MFALPTVFLAAAAASLRGRRRRRRGRGSSSGALSQPENPASKPIADDEEDELADEAPCRSDRTIENIMAELKEAEDRLLRGSPDRSVRADPTDESVHDSALDPSIDPASPPTAGFWSVSADYLVRHHIHPRVALYQPSSHDCPMPLKWLDVHRLTETNLDEQKERDSRLLGWNAYVGKRTLFSVGRHDTFFFHLSRM